MVKQLCGEPFEPVPVLHDPTGKFEGYKKKVYGFKKGSIKESKIEKIPIGG